MTSEEGPIPGREWRPAPLNIDVKYGLANPGVFATLNGEGHMRGTRQVFIRLAGCSVGCPQCDTDYSLHRRATASEIVDEVEQAVPCHEWANRWVWITGGEPTDHDLRPLVKELKWRGYSVAVATAGVKRIGVPVDWISMSPHTTDPRKLVLPWASEIKIVAHLNGMNPWEFIRKCGHIPAAHYFVQPLSVEGKEDPYSLRVCMDFLNSREGLNWSLSRQDHHDLELP